MKILYVARHAPADNEDELAIAHALEVLGHQVKCVDESAAPRLLGKTIQCAEYDFMLFHHWMNIPFITAPNLRIPKVFWTFDLTMSTDPSLGARINYRTKWLNDLKPHVVAGFLTDGDAVERDETGTFHHLLQGADERKAGYGQPLLSEMPPILFTGTIRHGLQRAGHIQELQARYGSKLFILGNGGPTVKKHGRDLANIFASTKVVIAPDGPITDRYWSNRVYLTLGLGGFLLHPFCAELRKQYPPETLVMYENREHLRDRIDYYLSHPEEREEMRKHGHEHTMSHHTYRHRCEELIAIVHIALDRKHTHG